jgi:uncharacterized membrane protein
MVIRNPAAWAVEQLNGTLQPINPATAEEYWPNAGRVSTPNIQKITTADLRYALRRGFDDFGAYRTDVIFLCIIYPLVGLLLARMAFGYDMLALVFPLLSGFALIGPFGAVGLNEMSRRREIGIPPRWTEAFSVLRSPAIVNIMLLGLVLMGMFLFWMGAAQVIYNITLGPQTPSSFGQFAHDVLQTKAGLTMAVLGIGVGFAFAVAVLVISVVSFPMLLDRNVSLELAVRTSISAVMANPVTIGIWGIVIAAGLVVGSIPALLGLCVVMPVLGHATWHLYRRVVRW